MLFYQSRVEKLLEVIRYVHTNPPWKNPEGFFSVLRQVIPFDYAIAFMKIDPRTHKIVPSHTTFSNSGGDDAGVIRDYNDYFWKFKRPILNRIMRNQFGSFDLPNTFEEHLTKAQFQQFKTDFWDKYKIRFVCARYVKTPQGWLSIYLSRNPDAQDFSEEEKLCLDMLSPHLQLVAEQGHSEQPCFFADALGQIVCIDPQSRGALERNTALAVQIRTELPGWIQQQLSEPMMPLDVSGNQQPCRVLVAPAGIGRHPLFRISWSLAEEEPPLPSNALQIFSQRYHLSPRERDVLACMVAGKQTKEMAQQLGLAFDTVKEYRSSLYHKVGVDGRGPLVAQLLSSARGYVSN